MRLCKKCGDEFDETKGNRKRVMCRRCDCKRQKEYHRKSGGKTWAEMFPTVKKRNKNWAY